MAESESGLFIDRSTPPQIADAIRRAGLIRWDRERIMRHAESFSEDRFIHEMRAHADALLQEGRQ